MAATRTVTGTRDGSNWWAGERLLPKLPRQELRIAASFSGGVSLAVWMSGLTYELDRLLRSSDAEVSDLGAGDEADRPASSDRVRPGDARYAALLRFLGVDVDVDVISGTSAGGINGVALGVARTHGSSLDALRDIWLKVGSFSELLRSVDESKPPSLLRGDDVMLRGLSGGLQQISSQAEHVPGPGRRTATVVDHSPFPSRRNQLRLLVTSTMTQPDLTTVRDSLGTAIPMLDNQAIFRFNQDAGSGFDASGFSVPHLAKAARSSASFPAAFEPSHVRVGDSGDDEGPDMSGHLGIRSSRWMIDGGLRNNEPVGQALRAVWEQPAGRGVRRVMLHVSPDPGLPGPTSTDKSAKANSTPPGEPLNVAQSLGATFSAPFVQTWRADLQAARQRSEGARRRRAGTKVLNDLIPVDEKSWNELTRSLRTVRSRWVADDFLAALDMQLGRFAATSGSDVGGSAVASARFDGLRGRIHTIAADHWAPTGAGRNVGTVPEGDSAAGPGPGVRVPEVEDLAHFGPDLFNATIDVVLRSLRGVERSGVGDSGMGRQIQSAADLVHRSRSARDVEAGSLSSEGQGGLSGDTSAGEGKVLFEGDLLVGFLQGRLLSSPRPAADGFEDWAVDLFDDWLSGAFARPDAGVGSGVDDVAELRPSWKGLLRSPAIRKVSAPEKAKEELSDSSRGLLEVPCGDMRALAAVIQGATELLALGDGRLADQEIELVQMSAQTRAALPGLRGLRQPADKIFGTRMGHFGAFVRRSWRANDWMWGRIDGVGWMLHLLLTPARLRQVASALVPAAGTDSVDDGELVARRVEAVLDRLKRIACADPEGNLDPELSEAWELQLNSADDAGGKTARDELVAAISAPDSVESLPELSRAMAHGMQRDVAAVELPEIARQMQLTEQGKRASPREVDRRFVEVVDANTAPKEGPANPAAVVVPGGGESAAPIRPEKVASALKEFQIHAETGPGDLLADSGVRSMAADAIAVGSAALHGSAAGVPVLPTFTGPVSKGARGMSHTLRSNSPAGWTALGLIGVGVVFLLLNRPVLTALGLPLIFGGVVALMQVGFRRVWIALAGVLASIVAAVFAVAVLSAHEADAWGERVAGWLQLVEDWAADNGIALVVGVVLLAGVGLTAAAVWLAGRFARLLSKS